MPVLVAFIHLGNHISYQLNSSVALLLTNHCLSQEVLRWIITYPEGGGEQKTWQSALGMCTAYGPGLANHGPYQHRIKPLQLPFTDTWH